MRTFKARIPRPSASKSLAHPASLPSDAAQALLQLLAGQVPQDVVLVACSQCCVFEGKNERIEVKDNVQQDMLKIPPNKGGGPDSFSLKPLTTSQSYS